MDASAWDRAQRLFHIAASLGPDAQAAFVAAAHDDDEQTAAVLAGMLEEDRGHGVLDRGLGVAASQVLGHDLHLSGTLGPYRILSHIGEGGMGVVYRAEREDIGSIVAIKVLRDAWLSPTRRSRFLAEQRTLAQLRHPSIASLYDAGTLPDGTPWFAMEYVEGVPITEACRVDALNLPVRLALFRDVCDAVQFAHERLVVHRDLKPSNILVARTGRGEKPGESGALDRREASVKLLDFGIARHLDEHRRPVDRTLTGLRLLTPAYASPQQLRGEPVSIDTDVYSLGVLLYELLTGVLPFGSDPAAERERATQAVRAPRPSLRARAGSTDAVRAHARDWADLDVLCQTAMHPDPHRRYRTVDALRRDVEHFLRREPLDARPDGVLYRTGKFVRRNSLPVSIAAGAVATIAGVVGVYTSHLRRARQDAVSEARRAQRIQQFMLRLLDGGDAVAGPANDLRVLTLVDRGVLEADALSHEPSTQADLYQHLGRLCLGLGQLERASTLLDKAASQRSTLRGATSVDLLETHLSQVEVLTLQARYDEGEALARAVLATAEAVLPRAHPLHVAGARALGRVLAERGDYDAAVPLHEQAIALCETGRATLELADSLHELANVHFYAGRYDDSESFNKRALAIYRQVLGPSHPSVGDTLINLGAIAFERGDDRMSETFMREGLALTEAWHGPLHFRTANNCLMLGRTLTRLDELDEAALVLQRGLAGREAAYGPNHPGVASVLNELGTIARKQGRLDDAEALYSRMAEIYRAVHGERRHFLNGVAASNLGSVASLRGEPERARVLLEDAVAIFSATQGDAHTNTAIARVKLASARLALGHPEEAQREVLAGLSVLEQTMKPEAFWMVEAHATLARARAALEAGSRI